MILRHLEEKTPNTIQLKRIIVLMRSKLSVESTLQKKIFGLRI